MMAKSSDLLISGGLVVTGDGVTRADILVSDGKIKELGQDLSNRPAARVIDASGNYVLPGGLDSHAHPIFADKMDTYSICAAYGGVTTVLPFIGSETYRHEIFDNHWGCLLYTSPSPRD